jgi:hypothetical protein
MVGVKTRVIYQKIVLRGQLANRSSRLRAIGVSRALVARNMAAQLGLLPRQVKKVFSCSIICSTHHTLGTRHVTRTIAQSEFVFPSPLPSPARLLRTPVLIQLRLLYRPSLIGVPRTLITPLFIRLHIG